FSFDTVDAQILTLYEVEDLVPEDVAAILALPVDHIRETLSRTRESEQTAPLSGAITELRKLKAPPGFSMAIRDCLAIEADYLRSRVARKRLIRSIVIALLIAGTVAGSWSIYRHFTDRPQRSMLPSSVDEPTNTFPTPPQETTPYRKPDTAPKTPTSPALHEKGVNATPSPPRQPNPQAIEETAPAASIPTILLSRPKNPVSSLEDIVAYVHPKLKVPPQRQGETWIVAVNEDQFWNMYRWLKAFYSDMRIPERAIPKGEEQRRIKFKQVDFIPRPTQGPTHPNN
ncbi:MAG: hypothetical protein OEV28_11820, partial [Nitrospirota bacterium]|nr:hypothetical protein [Nitrospirota bacterium]